MPVAKEKPITMRMKSTEREDSINARLSKQFILGAMAGVMRAVCREAVVHPDLPKTFSAGNPDKWAPCLGWTLEQVISKAHEQRFAGGKRNDEWLNALAFALSQALASTNTTERAKAAKKDR
jgi:hypothetical protein